MLYRILLEFFMETFGKYDIYRGIIIVEPHGTYIYDGNKTMIIKSLNLHNVSHKPLLLIQNKEALAVIYLDDPIKINLSKFNELRKFHKITEYERKEWWNNKSELYKYNIIKKILFEIPVPICYDLGPQVLVKPINIKKYQEIYIGTSGYDYKWWNIQDKHINYSKFDVYNKFFKTVEINASFYNYYEMNTWRKIIDASPIIFSYSIKVNRQITHFHFLDKILKNKIKTFFSPFVEIASKKIKSFLFQFPKNFLYNEKNVDKLQKIMLFTEKYANKKDCYKFAIEFRHLSWFNENIYNMFIKNTNNILYKNWTIVMSDLNVLSDFNNLDKIDTLKYYLTSNFIYVRMHGTKDKYNGPYSKTQLKNLALFIRSNHKQITNAFIYFNNTDSLSQNGLPDAINDAKKLDKILF